MTPTHPFLSLLLAAGAVWLLVNSKKIARRNYLAFEEKFTTYMDGMFLENWQGIGHFVSWAKVIIFVIVIFGFAYGVSFGPNAV